MNINDVLLRVLKKNDQLSEQIQHRNEEEEVKHALEIRAREARDREIAEKCQEEEWEITKLERLKQVEIDRLTEGERWHSEELKKIEKEARDRKLELERLREAASEMEEANRLKEAEEEEIAQLKRRLAAEEDNRRNNKSRSRSSETMSSSRLEDEEEDEEWGGNIMVEEASDREEARFVRSSKAKRSASGSPRRPLVESGDSTDDDSDLQSMRSSRLGPTRRKSSSASLREEDLRSMRTGKTKMAHRNLSNPSLHARRTEDDYTDEEDDYAPSSRRSSKGKRKPRTSSGSLPRNADDSGMGSPHWSGSNSRSGSPMYMSGMHPYFPAYGGSFPPPVGPYGYGVGMPGSIINSGIGNIINSTIANVGNDNSVVKNVYRK